ncbi:MAG: HEAT repeat domain-containing protein [Elusimicrobia bacterium]|nr:HEAT repeat domain-containing protein [Elusimicrobiota bacterium]
MRRLFALAVFLAAAGYLAHEYVKPPAPPPAPAEPPAASAPPEPGPVFSSADVAKVRLSLNDPDPNVRWAAIQLLYNIHDPELGPILEKMMETDPDTGLRIKIVGMMKDRPDLARLGGMIKGLQDFDKNVRIASLKALGDVGDPSVSTWVTALLQDPDPDVRIEALRTLGRFQDKRKAEYAAMAKKLRQDYEAALRRKAAEDGR